ncbi:2-iminoacetate synthase [Gillisia sp. Hel_I_86]|uniref:2-iminoacetate synthase ThiH n=1 Tax=Gillisia sp. Hel_I_86 TaxID=1249981 RepID=UPI00119C8E69|nr:2-iminoacetate synthase ThiH [Gillisia sp. Hel_I_86]TVZ26356.1 2-iminoacetate synthase [Gillisia sp. Hel_I_86]
MTSFKHTLAAYSWEEVLQSISSKTEADVRLALQKQKRSLEDFKAFISPAARPFLEEMAQQSRAITKKRFGNTMQMYAPLYLSNECQNICTYCGFSMTNKIPRKTLTDAEIIREAEFLKAKGYEHILLVTGEANRTVGIDYMCNAVQLLKEYFSNISIEIQPLNQDEYEKLIEKGLYATLVYQETYHRETYKLHHPRGKKSNFDYRLETADRLGRAGIHKIGIGALFGLEDWRADSFFTALHLKHLQKAYWKTKYSISFPRLRPFSGGLEPKIEMTDPDLLQVICAYRLLDEEVELSISTREREIFRDHIVHLGITSMSAESKTNPGGYVVAPESLEQFEISDERSTEIITQMLSKNGIEPVWKDWEKSW